MADTPETLPKHVAIIMDGNGRWAQQRNQHRVFGHQQGGEVARAIIRHCAERKLTALTLYSFSVDNWKRPDDEVQGLMELLVTTLMQRGQEMIDNNIRFRQIGRRDRLPERVMNVIEQMEGATRANTGLTLNMALDYGGRTELVEAMRSIAQRVQAGELDPQSIDADTISGSLYTADLPDPDLLIRTGGEMRVSDFLLWQISYAELMVVPTLWPDFSTEELDEIFRAFARRERRFGDVAPKSAVAR